MLAASASLLNIKTVILDGGEHGPAKQVVPPLSSQHAHNDGSFSDPAKLKELDAKIDVLTAEIEYVDADALEQAGCVVHPSPSTIKLIQDKLAQKQHLQTRGCPISAFIPVESIVESIRAAAGSLGLPLMLKSRTLGTLLSALPSSPSAETEAAAKGSGFSHAHPLVGVIMGSDSNLPVMLPRGPHPRLIRYPVRVDHRLRASDAGSAGRVCKQCGAAGVAGGHRWCGWGYAFARHGRCDDGAAGYRGLSQGELA
uniref:Phosphoribosylaminoimidazole carboxylase n=1 Tax=Mycena chlorophos TaxID=658473 RepID=A0ABQ0KXG5_MYCCL|nr:phosphoribosylaminoimidazole carboxylase [Mycena chlorophos]